MLVNRMTSGSKLARHNEPTSTEAPRSRKPMASCIARRGALALGPPSGRWQCAMVSSLSESTSVMSSRRVPGGADRACPAESAVYKEA